MKEAIVIIFLLSTVVIGVFSAVGRNRITTEKDMNLSGRKMGWFTLGTSAAASGCSAYAFVGMAAVSYTVGVSMLWYSALACTWSWGIFYLIGKRLRRMSIKTNTTTIVDYLSERVEDNKGIFRLIAAIIVVGFMLAYCASNFSAIASSLESYMGWPTLVGLLLGAVIVAVYSAIGGFKGVVLVDTIHGIVMLLGSAVFFVFILVRAGGMSSFMESITTVDPNLASVTGGKTTGLFVAFLLSWLGSGFMGFGNPHISVRAMGMKSEKEMRYAGIWSYIINVWVMYAGVFSGLAARLWLGELQNADLAYGMIVNEIMGPVLGGIIIAGIISATMSTVSSQLLVAASEISTNVFKRIKRQTSESRKVLVQRVLVVALSLVGVVLALNSTGLVYYGILFAWAGLGCALGPVLVISLFWKRMTWSGAFWGMITGTVVVIAWKLAGFSSWLYEGFPGLILSTLVVILVSAFTHAPSTADDLVKYASDGPTE